MNIITKAYKTSIHANLTSHWFTMENEIFTKLMTSMPVETFLSLVDSLCTQIYQWDIGLIIYMEYKLRNNVVQEF